MRGSGSMFETSRSTPSAKCPEHFDQGTQRHLDQLYVLSQALDVPCSRVSTLSITSADVTNDFDYDDPCLRIHSYTFGSTRGSTHLDNVAEGSPWSTASSVRTRMFGVYDTCGTTTWILHRVQPCPSQGTFVPTKHSIAHCTYISASSRPRSKLRHYLGRHLRYLCRCSPRVRAEILGGVVG
jgi:hypothetical protein